MNRFAISLFSGVGGLDLAASAAGFTIVAQVEIDPFCQRVLKHHAPAYWGNARLFGDVREFGRKDIGSRTVDLIFGGFPCQDISLSGKRAGITDGTRSGLWREFARIVGEIRPHCVFVENVASITAATQTQTGAIRPADALLVAAQLSEMGYVCRSGIISAADAGAAHIRKRWWLVGYADGRRHSQPTSKQDASPDEKRHGAPRQRSGRTEFYATVAAGGVLADTESSRRGKPGTHSNAVGSAVFEYRETNQSGAANGQSPQPGLVADADGLPAWLVGYSRPALINELLGCGQFDHEPPRTTAQKGANHAAKIAAVGNSVFVPTAYALFVAVREALSSLSTQE